MGKVNLSVLMGIIFFIIGIGCFIFILLSFEPTVFESKQAMDSAKVEWFMYGIGAFLVNGAIGALLIALGRIQTALEKLSDKY